MSMTQSDIIKNIAKNALASDYNRLLDSLMELVDYSQKKNRNKFAAELQSIITDSKRKKQFIGTSYEGSNYNDLVISTVMSSYKLEDLVCDEDVHTSLTMFLKEQRSAYLLKSIGLSLTNKILFYGPSGCGKTLAAAVIAGELEKPLITVNLGSIISAKLGETSKNLSQVFKMGSLENAIIFLDEFDSIGKIRDYSQDHGEMKRVVNTLLQLFDYIHDNAIVIAATNQFNMIDHALVRRFDLTLELKPPKEQQILSLIDKTLKKRFSFDSETSKMDFVHQCNGFSYYVIQKILVDAIKMTILKAGKIKTVIDQNEINALIKKERGK